MKRKAFKKHIFKHKEKCPDYRKRVSNHLAAFDWELKKTSVGFSSLLKLHQQGNCIQCSLSLPENSTDSTNSPVEMPLKSCTRYYANKAQKKKDSKSCLKDIRNNHETMLISISAVMWELNLQYKRTSWLTEQSKTHCPLYWTKNVHPLAHIFHWIHPWLTACCFLLGKKINRKNVLGGGEWRRKTFTQWFRGIV